MKKVVVAVLAASLLVSCSKKEASVVAPVLENEVQIGEVIDEASAEIPQTQVSLSNEKSSTLNVFSSGLPQTNSHQKYLEDELVFKPFDLQGNSLSDVTYLVGSDLCKLYPCDAFTEAGDGAYKMGILEGRELADIPFGTILKAARGNKRYADASSKYKEGFHFQDNVNYFYEVEYKGQKGVVFGADLVTSTKYSDYVSSSTHTNMIYSELLLKNNKYDEFRPVIGLEDLSTPVLSNLENDKLVIQHTSIKYLGADELINLYQSLLGKYFLPIFITTDLVSHSQHLVFDRMLQSTEQHVFSPRLLSLCNSFIETMKNDTEVPENVKDLAIKYFQVPQLALSQRRPGAASRRRLHRSSSRRVMR